MIAGVHQGLHPLALAKNLRRPAAAARLIAALVLDERLYRFDKLPAPADIRMIHCRAKRFKRLFQRRRAGSGLIVQRVARPVIGIQCRQAVAIRQTWRRVQKTCSQAKT